MNLFTLTDQDLHLRLKELVTEERSLLTRVLHHLREVERRRLYSDFGCSSLFAYVVEQLGYSEGQAHRRIQAMRLIRELPELEQKVSSGELSLCNISQAQGVFKRVDKMGEGPSLSRAQKLETLERLENRSTREGEKELIKLCGAAAKPKERERVIDEKSVEVRFVVSDRLKEKLERVRSLLGTKGAEMGYAELMEEMATLSEKALEEKRFGKRRVERQAKKEDGEKAQTKKSGNKREEKSLSASKAGSKNVRYISKKMRHAVWLRDGGRCSCCGGKHSLQYDHILPVGKGGETNEENLRLLCFSCNQRAAMKSFGVQFIERKAALSGSG